MSLADRALKVYFRRTRPSLTKRDTFAEAFVQEELGDTAYVVNKKLFKDPTNPVNQIIKQHDHAYITHKFNTMPLVDAGPRLLSSKLYMEYRDIMKNEIGHLDRLLNTVMPDYDKYVQMDVEFRTKQDALRFDGKPKPPGYKPPSVDEYPTAAEFRAATTCTLTFEALPDAPHWLLDEDKEDIARREKELERKAINHVVEMMLKPVKHLADKLAVPIGATDPETGQRTGVFRDSAIENIHEAITQARRLVIDSTPELETVFDELTVTMQTYEGNKVEWLRESPINRQAAADRLRQIQAQMGAIMGP